MRSKCVLNKNSNSDLRTQTQKLKISKSPFSQTQQYHQIRKTQQNPSHLKGNPANLANPSWSNLVADKYYCVSDLKTEEEKNSRFADSRIKIPIWKLKKRKHLYTEMFGSAAKSGQSCQANTLPFSSPHSYSLIRTKEREREDSQRASTRRRREHRVNRTSRRDPIGTLWLPSH